MSWEKFEDDCPGCRPVLLDPLTMKALADDDPAMLALNNYWKTVSKAEKEAFHRVTCLNSKDPNDLKVINCLRKALNENLAPSGRL